MSANKITNDLLRNPEMGALMVQLNGLKLSFSQSKIRKEFIEAANKEEEALNTYLKDLIEECADREEDGGYKYTDENKNFVVLKEDKKEEYQTKMREAHLAEMRLPKLSMEIIEKLDLTPVQYVIIETLLEQV